MVQIVCERNVIVSKASKGISYEFKDGQPVEVAEDHLEFFPGWGLDECEFKKLTGRKSKKESSKEEPEAPSNEEVD